MPCFGLSQALTAAPQASFWRSPRAPPFPEVLAIHDAISLQASLQRGAEPKPNVAEILMARHV